MATFMRLAGDDARQARRQGSVRLPAPTVLDGWAATAAAGPLGVTIEIAELVEPIRTAEGVIDTLFAPWSDGPTEADIRRDAMALVDHYKNHNRDTIATEWPTATLAH